MSDAEAPEVPPVQGAGPEEEGIHEGQPEEPEQPHAGQPEEQWHVAGQHRGPQAQGLCEGGGNVLSSQGLMG